MDKFFSFLKKQQGFTLFELMMVVGALAVITTVGLTTLNPQGQFAKARDARRKADLQKLKTILEDYFNDKSCYPLSFTCEDAASLEPYLNKVPCDPQGGSYSYHRVDCKTYQLYAKLENEKDEAIETVGCSGENGCPGNSSYNYGVCSTNTTL